MSISFSNNHLEIDSNKNKRIMIAQNFNFIDLFIFSRYAHKERQCFLLSERKPRVSCRFQKSPLGIDANGNKRNIITVKL